MRISENYKNLDKVREINFTKEEFCIELGKLVNDNSHIYDCFGNEVDRLAKGLSLFDHQTGVYIYQSCIDPLIGYRIYSEFNDYKFNGYKDEFLIQELNSRKVKLTKFPTGVVTRNDYIVGQEIPFYPNAVTLLEYFALNKNVDIISIYNSILDILDELYLNGILYKDIHMRNFLIDRELNIRLIDFESEYIEFDSKKITKALLINLKNMFENLSKLQNQKFGFYEFNSFEEARYQVENIKKLILK